MREEAERLYHRARSLPPEARAAFVREACRDDPELEAELLSLLERAESAETFFGLLADALASDAVPGARPPAGPADPRDGEGRRSGARPPVSPEPPPGHEVGRYRILERIGAGGMGSVYRARDGRLGRDVALKFLPPSPGADGEAEERLLVEARAAASLEHPNVCTVHEIGETDGGRPFIAMAYYRGETLKERLRRGPLPPPEATEVAMQLADGLAAAHARGVVHRDVKPGNVMLTAGGAVKLLDFGLADTADVHRSRSGGRRGTLPYMSPEQARGEALGPRTDLWSLGVVLYEMLTGTRPFAGDSDVELLRAILHRDPPAATDRSSDVPEALAAIVARLLRKDPDDRPGSAETLRNELARALPSADRSPRFATLTGRRRALAVGGLLTLLAVLSAAALWIAGPGEEPGPAVAERGGEPSLAVLPLADLHPDGRDAALAAGMTEELTGLLARVSGLRVLPGASVSAFADRRMDVPTLADSLRVASVLTGSLERIGSRLRVRVRLVDGRDGSTRWSEAYDRGADAVFEVQREIAESVARALQVDAARDAAATVLRHQSPNVAAYELYLRGSDQRLFRSDSGVRRGVRYFEQAIALDSTYAAAHAGLAIMYMLLSGRDDPDHPRREADELEALAHRAVSKALALDDSLAEAHAALGLIRRWLDRDYAAAERELSRAIALDPTRSRYRQWLAQLFIQTGRPAQAMEAARDALEIDPLSPTAHAEMAHALLANGHHDLALARLERIADLQPPLLRAAGYTARAHALKGEWEEAIAALRPQAERRRRSPTLALYGYLLARAGHEEEALRVHSILRDRWRRGRAGAFEIGVVYAGLGDLERAFTWLERSLDDGSAMSRNFHVMSPIFGELRRDPRFEPLRRRLGLPVPPGRPSYGATAEDRRPPSPRR